METRIIDGKECSTLVSLAEDMLSKKQAIGNKPMDLVTDDFFDIRQERGIEHYARIGNCNYYLITDTEIIRQAYIEKIEKQKSSKKKPVDIN